MTGMVGVTKLEFFVVSLLRATALFDLTRNQIQFLASVRN